MTSYDPATEPKRPEMTLGDLFSQMTADVGTLMRKEIELAKAEARDDMRRAKSAGVMYGGAGLGGWMAVLFVSLAAAWLLDQAMNTALAFLIVAVVWGVAAAVMANTAKKRMKTIEALPETRETLKEDMEWARAQTN